MYGNKEITMQELILKGFKQLYILKQLYNFIQFLLSFILEFGGFRVFCFEFNSQLFGFDRYYS